MRCDSLAIVGSVLCLLWSTDGLSQSTTTIQVESARPVYAMLVSLERSADITFTYEDPLLVFEGDTKTIVEKPVNDEGRELRAKGGVLRVTYPSELSTHPERAQELVNEVLRQAAAAGYKFVARRVGAKSFHVFPVAVHDQSGIEQSYAALLETRISLPAKQRTGLQFLIDVLRQVRDLRGVKMHFWSVQDRALRQQIIQDGAQNERASDLISRLFSEDATWSLECMPREACYFNVVPFKHLPASIHP